MYRESLLERCTQLYGKTVGTKLHRVMAAIARRDFCVATGLDAHSVSILRSCNSRGRIFSLSKNYKFLVMPSGIWYTVDSLTYQDIAPLLPLNSANQPTHRHCFMDDPVRCGFDMSSLI